MIKNSSSRTPQAQTALQLEPLAAIFDAKSESEWRSLVEASLKGADFNKKLVTTTADGNALPLYTLRKKNSRSVKGEAKRWHIAQRVDHPEKRNANVQALSDLENGADALTLVYHSSSAAHGFGLAQNAIDNPAPVIESIELDLISMRIDAGNQALKALDGLLKYAQRKEIPLNSLNIDAGADPLSDALQTKNMAQFALQEATAAKALALAAKKARELHEKGFTGRVLLASSRAIHEAGGTPAQELAFAIASARHYQKALIAEGLSPQDAAQQCAYLLIADQDQFMTLAKFRALRLLIARIEELEGRAKTTHIIHAETAWRMLSRYDVPVNMLRNSLAVFAAATGGANTITMLPHSAALGLPDALARRIARNTQMIFAEESQLWRVADPAAGSGALEDMTDQLCTSAWNILEEIENAGGLIAALSTKLLQDKVLNAQIERAKNIAKRKIQLTGTSEYPDLLETPTEVERAYTEAQQMNALPAIRDSKAFETIRDLIKAKGNAAPKVYLATWGTEKDFAGRAGFAKGVFETGGLTTIRGNATTDIKTFVEAFKASGAEHACLCSSDEFYVEIGNEAFSSLKQAGAKSLFLAGKAGDLEATFKSMGMNETLYAGIDVISFLNKIIK